MTRNASIRRALIATLAISCGALPACGSGSSSASGDDTAVATEQYSPVWTPDGNALTVGQEAFTSQSEPAVVLGLDGSRVELTTPDFGFDVPIAWSGDGRYLAVRSFDGRNSVQPGLQRTMIVDREGARIAVDVPSEVIFLGWYAGV